MAVGRPRLRERLTRDVLLVTLTVATGAVDAITWIALDHVFSAFMTGNLVLLGLAVAGATGPPLIRVAASLAAFAAGAALGGRLVSPEASSETWPWRVTLTLGAAVLAEAAFLVLWAWVDGRPSSATAQGLIALSALAMGMQTLAVFSLGVRAVFTTAATATWTALMGDLTHWSKSREERHRLAAVIGGLLTGAFAGGLLMAHARILAPVLPLGLTAIVVGAAASERRGRVPHRGEERLRGRPGSVRGARGGEDRPADRALGDAA